MPSQPLTFTGAGGAKLAARLELPIDGPPTAFALFAHCFTCSKNLRAVANISRTLRQEGIGVLVGGTDTGPSPYDLLLAALGACKTITLRMYADRKGWPLEEVIVALEHRKLHATDAEKCEDRLAKLDEIRSALHLVGPLDQAQRQRLAEIADRCPVNRTLDAGVQLVSKLENGALASGSAQH